MKAALWSGWAFPPDALAPVAAAAGLTVVREPEQADIWLAWSLGGLYALKQLGERPAVRPRLLVLIASTARFCADTDWPGMPAANLRALQRQLARAPGDALRGFHRLCAGEQAAASLIDERTAASQALDLPPGLRALAELDLRPQISSIDLQILLLHGAHDRVIPPAAAHALSARLPNARLREHPEAGHDLPLTHPGWIAAHLHEMIPARR